MDPKTTSSLGGAAFPEDPEQILENTKGGVPQSETAGGVAQGTASGLPQGDPLPLDVATEGDAVTGSIPKPEEAVDSESACKTCPSSSTPQFDGEGSTVTDSTDPKGTTSKVCGATCSAFGIEAEPQVDDGSHPELSKIGSKDCATPAIDQPTGSEFDPFAHDSKHQEAHPDMEPTDQQKKAWAGKSQSGGVGATDGAGDEVEGESEVSEGRGSTETVTLETGAEGATSKIGDGQTGEEAGEEAAKHDAGEPTADAETCETCEATGCDAGTCDGPADLADDYEQAGNHCSDAKPAKKKGRKSKAKEPRSGNDKDAEDSAECGADQAKAPCGDTAASCEDGTCGPCEGTCTPCDGGPEKTGKTSAPHSYNQPPAWIAKSSDKQAKSSK